MTQTPTDAPRLVPGKRLRPESRVQPGDVLRVVESFTNPDLLTKGDVVIVQSQGDDGNIVALNLFRNTAQYGFNPTRYAFVHRPATRMKAEYSPMSAAAPASPLPGGGWRTDFENAPKDGTDVLVAPHMAVVSWDFGAERWIVGVIPLNDDRTIADDWTVQPVMFFEQYLSNWGVEPTHWMPLPAAPTGDARNGKGER